MKAHVFRYTASTASSHGQWSRAIVHEAAAVRSALEATMLGKLGRRQRVLELHCERLFKI